MTIKCSLRFRTNKQKDNAHMKLLLKITSKYLYELRFCTHVHISRVLSARRQICIFDSIITVSGKIYCEQIIKFSNLIRKIFLMKMFYEKEDSWEIKKFTHENLKKIPLFVRLLILSKIWSFSVQEISRKKFKNLLGAYLWKKSSLKN